MATLATVTSLATMQFEFSQTGCGNECSRYVHSLNKPEVEHNIMITHARIADDTVESDRLREGGRRGARTPNKIAHERDCVCPPSGVGGRNKRISREDGRGDPWEGSLGKIPLSKSLGGFPGG